VSRLPTAAEVERLLRQPPAPATPLTRAERLAATILLCVIAFAAALTINGMAPQFLFMGGALTGICGLAGWLAVWDRQ